MSRIMSFIHFGKLGTDDITGVILVQKKILNIFTGGQRGSWDLGILDGIGCP